MSALAKLKLVSAVVERKSPMVSRRNKLTGKLEDQIRYAKALTAGETYAAKRVRFVRDENSGERKQVEIATCVKQWWWTASNGKVMLALRYGSKAIELAKGKNAIELGGMDDLIGALETVKAAVVMTRVDVDERFHAIRG